MKTVQDAIKEHLFSITNAYEIMRRLLCYLFFYLQNIGGNLYAAKFHLTKFKVIVSISHINSPVKSSEVG